MAGVGRRGFLRLIAAAPVAAPVIAREAAQKAGVSPLAAGMSEATYGVVPPSPSGGGDWIKDTCKRVFSQEWEETRREQMMTYLPNRLDPDLASSRSLSLSAALLIQRDRNIERHIEGERADALRSFRRFFKMDFRP